MLLTKLNLLSVVKNKYYYSTESFDRDWNRIQPVSLWYNISETGHSPEYEKENKGLSGIYIYRNKLDRSKCYVGLAFDLTMRFINHRWHFNAFQKGGYSSTPYFDSFVSKYGWVNFEIAVLKYVPESKLIDSEKEYLINKPSYNLMYYSIDKRLSHSDETKQVLSDKFKGSKNPMWGISLNISDERKKHLKSLVGDLSKNKNKPLDFSTKLARRGSPYPLRVPEVPSGAISNSLLNPYYYIYKKALDEDKNNLIPRGGRPAAHRARDAPTRGLVLCIKYIKYVAEYIGVSPVTIKNWLNTDVFIKDIYAVYTYDLDNNHITLSDLENNPKYDQPLIVLDSSRNTLEVFIGLEDTAFYLGVSTKEVMLSIDQDIILDTPLYGPVTVETYKESLNNPRARIIKFYLNEKLVQIYPSLKSAADSLGIKPNTLSSYISGKRPGNKYPFVFKQLIITK